MSDARRQSSEVEMRGGWRMLRLCIALLVAFVVLPLFAARGAGRLRVVTGTVAEWQAGQLISVVNEQTDPGGVRIALRDTVYIGDPVTLRPGVRVTVWYEFVGERRPVATQVAVLAPAGRLRRENE